MDQIDKLLADIDAVRQFHREPVVEIVSTEQRVCAFLTEISGNVWAGARVVSYQVPGNATVHMVFGSHPAIGGDVLTLITEDKDGNLAQPWGVEAGNVVHVAYHFLDGRDEDRDMQQAQAYIAEREELNQIIPDLYEIGDFLRVADGIKHGRRVRLMGAVVRIIDHLYKHLKDLAK